MPTAPTGRDPALSGAKDDEPALTLDDLVGDLGPFDGTDWKFFCADELVSAMLDEPDERLKRRRGRPPKPFGAPRSTYDKTEKWWKARAKSDAG
jgi:hypothetical protein